MEIELPDGTILEAPDGSDASAVAKSFLRNQRIEAIKKSNPGEYDPTSKEWQDRHDPTKGMSGYEKFMAGAGKSVVDLGRGVKQIGLELAQPFRSPDLTSLVTGRNQAERYKGEIDEAKRLDAPLMSSGAGTAGYIGGSAATSLLPAGALARGAQAANYGRTALAAKAFMNPATFKAAAAGGALQGALQPVGTNDSRLLNTGIGAGAGVVGQGVSKTVGMIAQPIKNALTTHSQQAVNRLKTAGVPLDAAQQSGSERVSQLKRFLTDNPITASAQKEQFEKTATGFDRAALKTIGESADVADEAVMNRAANRIGGVMDTVAARNPVKADNHLLNSLSNISTSASKELESNQATIIHNQVDEIIDKASGNGSIDGKAYQNIRDSLGRIAGSGSPGVKHWAGQLRSELDAALQRSASPKDAAALKQARIQWRNMEGISKVIGSEHGQHISPSRLANALNTKPYGGKNAMVRGRGATDLMKLAKAGKAVLPDKFPQSGTAPRAALQLLLPGAIGAGYGYAKEGDLSGAAMYGAGGVLAPKLAQQLLNRPRIANYMANGLQGPFGRAISAPNTQMFLQQVPKLGLLEALQEQ